MRTKVFLKTVALSAVILFSAMAASAANKNNLIYNSEEKDGMMVGQTVYKMDSGTLANYMKYSYKYDDQKRMTESENYEVEQPKEYLGKRPPHLLRLSGKKYHYHLL